jgi:hypothetical protein
MKRCLRKLHSGEGTLCCLSHHAGGSCIASRFLLLQLDGANMPSGMQSIVLSSIVLKWQIVSRVQLCGPLGSLMCLRTDPVHLNFETVERRL